MRSKARSTLRGALAAATAALALAAAEGASAANGDLTFADCVEDDDPGFGPDACALQAGGLDRAIAVEVSPDGRDAYAVSFDGDSSINHLRRNTVTGELTDTGDCFADIGSPEDCTSVGGLNGAQTIAISPDGASLYVGSYYDDAIVRFDRDTVTGSLTPQGCVRDDDGGDAACAQTMEGVRAVEEVKVSPDGEHLYAASSGDYAVAVLDRDTGTGAIAPIGCVRDTDSPAGDACGGDIVAGLAQAKSIAISPDGSYLYTAAPVDRAIVRFSRNAVTGGLTSLGCTSDNWEEEFAEQTCTRTDGLENAFSLAISPDAKSLYVVANNSDAVSHFARDTGDGSISFQGCVQDDDSGGEGACTQEMGGLDSPVKVAVSHDNRSVYVTGNGDDSVAVLGRDATSGALTPSGCVDDNDSGPDSCARTADGLDAVDGIALSPDGEAVYTAARSDDAITRFDREQSLTPVQGQRVLIKPVAGNVTVKVPGSNSFVALSDLTRVPIGSSVDTTRGTVELTSAADQQGNRQQARFKYGQFKVAQTVKKNAYTELKVQGPVGACPKGGKGRRRAAGAAGPVAESAGRRRRLWGSGKGRFRTSGRRGSGAARGTVWEVTDLCRSKTRIKSIKGTVTARDFVRKRTVILQTGEGYVAPGRPGRRRG